MDKKVVTIILARGGSKSLPRKNILPIMGKPMISYAIEASEECPLVDRTIVSTDDEEIAKIARDYGAETPFLRPKELSGDYANAEECLMHAVDWLKDNEDYLVDIVSYVQVTDLFKKKYMLEQCINALLLDPTLDTAFVGYQHHKNYWLKVGEHYRRITPGGNTARQIKESVFREDTGLGCATRVDVLRSGRRIGDRVKIIATDDVASGIDIHDDFDFWLTEAVIRMGKRTIND